jgi:hypothetical protein
MFSKHVTKELSAYCHGEVAIERSRQIAEHLIGCNGCRAQFEEIKLGVRLAERLPQVSPPDSLWSELQTLIAAEDSTGANAARKQSRSSFKLWQPAFVGVAVVLVLVVGFGVWWLYPRESRPSWEVARINGAPRIGTSRIDDKGRLAVGQWLETDANSRAEIEVSSIGQVKIDPNTRIRLVETNPTEHRLELAYGKLSAQIWAPPRLFFVDTASAVAADLGCAYTLEADDRGAGLLHVTSGWVALQLKDRESMVPAGASCATRPGVGPGTPYFDDASESFRVALADLDFGITTVDIPYLNSPLERVLAESRQRDTLTLWHLLARVKGNDRARVYDRLAGFTAPPDGVTREGVLQLNEQMLQEWKDKLVTTWGDESIGGVRHAWVKIWTRVLGGISGVQGKR